MTTDENNRSDEDLKVLLERARSRIKGLEDSRGDFLRSADGAIEKMAKVSGRPNKLRTELGRDGDRP